MGTSSEHTATWPERVERALEMMAAGRPVVLVHGEGDGTTGDVVCAAELACVSNLAFMIQHTSGFVCVALSEYECDRLHLPLMSRGESNGSAPAYCVSVDLRADGTGISAGDRARTIAALSSNDSGADDFTRPGHVIPVRAHADGVMCRRPGRAEAAVDLALLAGLSPGTAFGEIVSATHPTEMARDREIFEFAREHELALVTSADIVAYRLYTGWRARRDTDSSRLSTTHGDFTVLGYRTENDGPEHTVLQSGSHRPDDTVPVYVHQECATGDLFHSTACGCSEELDRCLAAVSQAGSGIVIYLRACGDQRSCTWRPDRMGGHVHRDAAVVIAILEDLGIESPRVVHAPPQFVSAYNIGKRLRSRRTIDAACA